MPATSSPTLPRARLRPPQQPPLDAITVYNTATHCYLLATDSQQRDFHLLACRKHGLDAVINGGEAANAHHNSNVSESELDNRSGLFTFGTPSPPQQVPFISLEDLHDYTTYAVYSPTEAASLVEALQREHHASMHVSRAVALIGAVRFTEGYYLVLATERRMVGYLGVHRLFEASQIELVSLLLDNEWVAVQNQTQWQPRRGGDPEGLSLFSATTGAAAASSGGSTVHRKQPPSYRKSTTSATAAAAAYLFQRRSLEKLHRQQFISSLSRPSSFFYSHSYDLTNTVQRNMLADGAEASAEDDDEGADAGRAAMGRIERNPGDNRNSRGLRGSAHGAGAREVSSSHPDNLLQPRMQFVWNEYLLEPWQLPEQAAGTNVDAREERRNGGGSEPRAAEDTAGTEAPAREKGSTPPLPSLSNSPVPQYPAAFARWRTYIIHGYITQRTVVVRHPVFHTLLLTLIARVSKDAAGVRYLRRGINSDGQVANHVEVEQIVSDESAWNQCFTDGAISSYVQLRGSVPLRWYHPPTASPLLLKPPIVIGPHDAEWSSTCLHFQDLLRQYGRPILIHDLLKRKEHHTRESALGDAYRVAVQALSAAVTRAAAGGTEGEGQRCSNDDTAAATSLRSSDVLQYVSTDLRHLGPLAWNTMTAIAEHHFDQVRCFVCRRRQHVTSPHADPCSFTTETQAASSTRGCATAGDGGSSVATQVQRGVVRSNCLDCIDRTNLGHFFHGLQALGEQLAGLGLLRHAAELRDSPAVAELLLEMYLAMGDALATQYGGSAQVGAGVLHRGAGWDQLMGVKRLYNNMMGDRDKQEAISLLLGRTQLHPRRFSRARNTAMHSPRQVLTFALNTSLPGSTSLTPPITAAAPSVAAAAARASPSNESFSPASSESALVPAPSSFFSTVLSAASRWWGEVTGASSASSTAAVEALRAAQHAAAEAEAEPDYYEHVSAGPRLPPAGLLATWWVQPLREFAGWYAACGIGVGRCTHSAQPPIPRSNEGGPDGESGGAEAAAPTSPFLPSSLMPCAHSSAAVMTTSHLSPASTTSAAMLDDVFAQQLLAEDSMAQQRWLLHVARGERQACLQQQPLQQQRGGRPASARIGLGTAVQGSKSTSPAANINPSLSRGEASGDGSATPSAPAAVSISLPSESAWAMDESVGAVDPAGLAEREVLRRGGSVPSDSAAAVAAAAMDAHSSFAPFSLTLAPSLVIGTWTVLRTTTQTLSPDAAFPTSAATAHASARRNVGKLKETLPISAALRLLYAWRGEKHGPTKAQEPLSKFTLQGNQWHPAAWSMDRSLITTVMRQLLGYIPSDVAATSASLSHSSSSAASWELQKWRYLEEAHDHTTFPRVVQTSVFARQEKELEQVVFCETMWIAASHDTPAKPAPSLPDSKKGSRVEPSLRKLEKRHTGSKQGLSPPQQIEGQRATTGCALEDQQFTAALLSELYGPPAEWGVDEVIMALQRMISPSPLSSAVRRVLRHHKLQPPLSGAELSTSDESPGIDRRNKSRDYWQRRLSVAAENTSPQRATQKSATAASAESGALHSAVMLLYCLSSILRSPTLHSPEPLPFAVSRLHTTAPAATLSPPFYSRDHERAAGASEPRHPHSAAWAEEASVAAVAPLLHGEPGDLPASVRYQLLFPDHPSLSEPTRRYWVLCRLLQFLVPSRVLSPRLLHGMLQSIFCDVPSTGTDCACVPSPGTLCPHRHARHHVRYTFALSPKNQTELQQPSQRQREQQIRSQLADGTLTSSISGGGTESGPASSPSTLRSMHIPATWEVKRCCTTVELFSWCVHCRRAHVDERLPHVSAASVTAETADTPRQRRPDLFSAPYAESDEDAADASWRLLWWAVENNLVVPVVRRREQTTLEVLADETALFCTVESIPRVALNVERRNRGEVWRRTQQQRQQQQSLQGPLAGECSRVGGSSAIYGVCLASPSLVYRLPRRNALVDTITLSETIANLGLRAATRLQEFFCDYIKHGWARTSLRTSRSGDGSGGYSTASTGHATVSRKVSSLPPAGTGATVALFGGIGGGGMATAVATGSDGGFSGVGSGYSAAAETSVAVTPADVIAHFSQLAEECLQSIQSVMVALQFVSLDALADEQALHCYISFFVNVYNAAYVVAWLTNVKELTSSAVAAADKMKAPSIGAPRPARPSTAAAGSALRTIDLLSLPTLCNTNIACFMHTYGVVIGHVFMSLGEMKYGVLGGNRPPPYRDIPLWPSSLDATTSSSPSTQQHPLNGAVTPDSSMYLGSESSSRPWKWWSLVPPHLRVEIPETARLSSLREHPHLQAALDWRELCGLYVSKGTANKKSAEEGRCTQSSAPEDPESFPIAGKHQPKQSSSNRTHATSVSTSDALFSPPVGSGIPTSSTSASSHKKPSPTLTTSSTATTAPLYPTTPAFEQQRERYRELVDLWSADVVRHLPFRISLQLIDTYLPPPLFHLCHSAGGSSKTEGSGGGGAGGLDGRGMGGASVRRASLDTHLHLDVDAERVPWYLQPILNTMPLVHPTLQSSKLGAVYGVAREGDGQPRGTLVPQLSPEANGVLLQPSCMWSSPSYYVVGGDCMKDEESIAHSFLLLQSLSGSYLGTNGYRTGDRSGPMMQHLCAPLHHEEFLAQLHATEVAFRSALRSTDRHIFAPAQEVCSPAPPQQQGCLPPQQLIAALESACRSSSLLSQPTFGVFSATSCSATLHNAMKPLLYEWCRETDQGMESISLLAKPGSQLRILLKVVQLLEASYVSGEAVRRLQRALREIPMTAQKACSEE
ncbi:putative inositol polyphosphate phosphatase [Leptomonas seymouri]|uniref:Putative inositol polyphosphate phosphatase n=1 Tax=Leptomonas seymouri TaxID=5684 RepID=A0A0N1PE31_LEPSE|nr:putative inositol polyphosphate phosphatase [Leptomonas seymouri]|eukprot:KPI86422.1 putative inositol polyphosphate phosphatase [Leptomonas seymouri]